MKVFLDLDRTLLNTAVTSSAIWDEIATLYPDLDVASEDDRQHDFYVSVPPDSYYYDLSAHLGARGLDPVVVAQQLVDCQVADNRLLLPGADNFIRNLQADGHELAILSFGEDYYQRLKVALCPELAGIPVYTTLAPKGEFLADKGVCVLVDDKNIAAELPHNVQFIWVQLADEPKSVSDPAALDSLEAVYGKIKAL